MRLGIDVGGTNTDAVLVEGSTILAATKHATSEDIASGIINAIAAVMDSAQVSADNIEAVMIGTTQFTNAFVERRCLDQVAVVRLCLPASQSLSPLADWPEDLKAVLGECSYLTAGGYEFDGRAIAPLDEDDLERIAIDINNKQLSSVAISSVFSPVRREMESRAAAIIRKHNPCIKITLSNDIGRMGLLERENAAVMNASLATHATKVVASFKKALEAMAIRAPFLLTQNDGTLMNADTVERFPIMTFSSGPTNSMRGAAWLSGVENALVIDIGGTTCDVGALVNGFPRESAVSVDIGGVRTNFRMPDVLAIGVGGGSLVDRATGCKVGPQSVGYRLTGEALVFGGKTLTATDIAVAAGYAEIGNKAHLSNLPPELIDNALSAIQGKVEDALDRMKTQQGDVAAILVGGGSVLVGARLKGVDNLIRPDHFAVANAVGAAIAQVGGELDRVYAYSEIPREQALADARERAMAAAVKAGAAADSVTVVDIEEVPLAYLPNGAVRIRVKAVGDLDGVKSSKHKLK